MEIEPGPLNMLINAITPLHFILHFFSHKKKEEEGEKVEEEGEE
jgi:hypothetical protein